MSTSTHSSYSSISSGWQFKTWHIFYNVTKRIPRALPVFKIDKFAGVISIFSASAFDEIFLSNITQSKLTLIIAST